MIVIEVCIGSSCHIKGSQEIVNKVKEKIEDNNLSDKIVLMGNFCTNNCNRKGVTISVEGNKYTGITSESFEEFWNTNILPLIESEENQ